MSEGDANLFGSDNEEENDEDQQNTDVQSSTGVLTNLDSQTENATSQNTDMGSPVEDIDSKIEKTSDEVKKTVVASDEKDSALFGSDDDDDNDDDAEKELGSDEDGEDGRSRFTSKQQDLDDLFGGTNTESIFTAAPPVVKKVITVSKLCIPERTALPDPAYCIAIKMPNFVKIAPTRFDPEKLNVEEESKMMGGATSVIRWRYKVDENGDFVIGQNGEPEKESNARLVKLYDGTFKLLVGDATFFTAIHKTEKRYAFVQTKSAVDPSDSNCDPDTAQDTVLECAGTIQQLMALRPEKGKSAVNSRMTDVIKDKYGVKREVKKDFDNLVNPETAQNLRAKNMEEELRKTRKRNTLLSEGHGAGYNHPTRVATGGRRPSMSAAYLLDDNTDYDNVNISDLRKGKRGDRKKQSSGKRPKKSRDDEDDDGGFIDSNDDEDVDEYYNQDEEDDEEDEEVSSNRHKKKEKDRPKQREEKAYVDKGVSEEEEEDEDDDDSAEEEDVDDGEESDDDDEDGDDDDDDDEEGEKKGKSMKKSKSSSRDKSSRRSKDKRDKKKRKASKKEAQPARRDSDSGRGERGEEGGEEEEDEEAPVQSAKRVRRTIIDSDDEE